MKAYWAAVPLTVTAALVWVAYLQHDAMRNACYEAGRTMGGYEQRIFDAVANGDQPMKREQDAIAKGPPDNCR